MSTQGISLESSDTRDTPPPWFLQDETWVIQRVAKDADCVVDIEFELRSFVNSVDSLLRQWIKHGHNGFIHRRLYEKGMPACIQDAFTTLATYISRTSAVEEAVLQIADDRSTSLIRQRTPTAIGAQGILAQLARVQALFIYEFIQLFDGSIRVRASAEKQLPILRKWVVQMWEMVKDYRGEEGSLVHDKCAANEFEKEYDTYSDLWRKWILTESVRRTHMVVESTINVYEAMTKGWAECAGAAMVTARRGLWEADSALEWFGLSCERSPLLVPSLQPGPVLSQYEAEEFDDLVKMVWAIIVGSDRMQYWRERKSNLCSRGYRHIDTARNYGASESRLGQAETTSKLIVHTKVKSGPPGEHEPLKIQSSIEQSLDALQTSSVETMFLHTPDRQTPFEDTLKAMNDAFQQGKFKQFGLSNYSPAEVQRIVDICEEKGYVKPSVYQGQYNPLVRGGEKDLFSLLRKHNMAFYGFSPSAGGFFADNVATSGRWSDISIVGKVYIPMYSHPSVQASAATVRDAAQKHGISGHAAALRWTAFHSCLSGHYGDGVIFGVSKLEHLDESLDALEAGPLPVELAEALGAIYATVAGNEPPCHL
ncbi:putative aldo/keto reductase [Thozetella sp. PMI_491]|nr:putative aldo/keto reductase [Thozetella sp. PMI_491]